MAYSLENTTDLTNLADAIRAKTGNSGSLSVADMATEVASISTGGSSPDNYLEYIYDNNNTVIEINAHFNVTNPPNWEFSYDNSLQTVRYIGSSTKVTGSLMQCTNLQIAILPSNVTEIGEAAFADCYRLQNITFPNTLTKIGNQAFRNCRTFTNITIPDSVTDLGTGAFSGCSGVTSITIGTGITTLPFNFMQDFNLITFTVPAHITTINGWVFRNMANLTTIYFEGTPTSIASNMVYNCSSLTDIYVPWSEGDVANAPWGATNATIHYNWTPSN